MGSCIVVEGWKQSVKVSIYCLMIERNTEMKSFWDWRWVLGTGESSVFSASLTFQSVHTLLPLHPTFSNLNIYLFQISDNPLETWVFYVRVRVGRRTFTTWDRQHT